MTKFELGKVYYARGAIGEVTRVVIPIGRSGRTMQFAFIDGLASGEVTTVDGKEFVRMEDEQDVWTSSSAVEASANETAIVNDILKRS